jgi:hypothetical protein
MSDSKEVSFDDGERARAVQPAVDSAAATERQVAADEPTPALHNEDDASPGDAYKLLTQMDDILDKLRLLNYEKDFVKSTGPLRKPISQSVYLR